MNKCLYIFTRGISKNKLCDKNNCKLHKIKASLLLIPDEVIRIIISFIFDFQILGNLLQTCKTLNKMSDFTYQTLYTNIKYRGIYNVIYNDYNIRSMDYYNLTPYQRLTLINDI